MEPTNMFMHIIHMICKLKSRQTLQGSCLGHIADNSAALLSNSINDPFCPQKMEVSQEDQFGPI